MAYNLRDFYYHKAKENNYAARSVFKLEEIDAKLKLFKPGIRVLDLGCAPGSWAQYASAKISGGKNPGFLIGIDLQKVQFALPAVHFIQGDAFEEATIATTALEHGIEKFDIVMSDMAPRTTGIRITDQERSFQLCLRALDVACRWLVPGGTFITKIFQGPSFDQYIKDVKVHFDKVEIHRPKSVRKASFEVYVVANKLRRAVK